MSSKLTYPTARLVDQVDDYHGVKVADPYRWLEDADSDETKAWIEAENKLTASYLSDIEARGIIQKRLTSLWNYERFGLPSKKGNRYFYTRNSGLQNQPVLYVAESLDAEPRVLLDPNTLSKDGTVALSGTYVSEDGSNLAYGIAAAGSDWVEFRVRSIESGKDLPDLVKWVKFSGASWTKDGKGFFYSRYDAPKEGAALQQANYNQKLFYHTLGEDQAKDKLIYERPDHPDWGSMAEFPMMAAISLLRPPRAPSARTAYFTRTFPPKTLESRSCCPMPMLPTGLPVTMALFFTL